MTEENMYDAPVSKKMKCSPTDLTILLGEEKYEYQCHSQIMANHSDFIDAALAMPMKESETRTLELPDIRLHAWGLMMHILDSPMSLPSPITMRELILAAQKFDEYQFLNGCASCDVFIANSFQVQLKMFESDPSLSKLWRIDDLIQYALDCWKIIPLKKSKAIVVNLFRAALTSPQKCGSHYGGLIFTAEHLKRLAPMIAAENLLGMKWTKEEILCPLFPKYFLTTLLNKYKEKRLGFFHMGSAVLQLETGRNQFVDLATLKNTATTPISFPFFEGYVPFSCADIFSQDLRNKKLVLMRYFGGDWVVAATESTQQDGPNTLRILWKCPLSMNCADAPRQLRGSESIVVPPMAHCRLHQTQLTTNPLTACTGGMKGGLRGNADVLARELGLQSRGSFGFG